MTQQARKDGLRYVGLVLSLALAPNVAAHGGHMGMGGFLDGVAHPLSGVDHILMALAAGLLWARLAPANILRGFMVFAGCLVLGYFGARMQFVLSLPEALLAGTVVSLGVLLAVGRMQPQLMFGLVAVSAIVHGLAHGLEAGQGSGLAYLAGLLGASLALFAAAAMAHAVLARHTWQQAWLKGFGALCTVCGLAWLGLG